MRRGLTSPRLLWVKSTLRDACRRDGLLQSADVHSESKRLAAVYLSRRLWVLGNIGLTTGPSSNGGFRVQLPFNRQARPAAVSLLPTFNSSIQAAIDGR